MDQERELKTLTLDIKSFAEDGTFTGLLSVYDVIDSYNDVVERGAYTKTLQDTGGRVPLLWQHDTTLPIGTLDLKDGPSGLEASGRLLLDDAVPQAKTAYALLKAGVIRGMSIGFKAIKKKQEDSIRRLKEIKLFEGSLVTFGACPGAIVHEVKSLGAENKDFMAELQAIETYARHYQMLRALDYALDRIRYGEGSRDVRVGAVQAVLEQFSEAYLTYFPTLMDLWGVKGAPKFDIPDVIPVEVRSALSEWGKQFIQLADPHSGTRETRAAGAADPAVEHKGIEPEAFHSLLNGFHDAVTSAFRA